jgi:hypothetical protein
MDQVKNFGMPKKGDLQHFIACGPFTPSLTDLMESRGYHGLTLEASYLYGTVRDRKGDMYTLLRRVPSHVPSSLSETDTTRKAPGRRLMFQTNRGDPDLHFNLEVMKNAGVSDGYTLNASDDRVSYRSGAEPKGNAWSIDVFPDALEWREDQVLDLKGTMIPLALQWYLIDREDSLFYSSRNFRVSGEVMGEPVEGFIFLDQVYMPEGGRLYAHRDSLMGQAIEVCWFSWGTEWDDGTIEIGHFLGGNDRAAFGMATDGKTLTLLTNDVSVDVKRDEAGYWHDGIAIDAGGERWEIVPDPRGRQVDMMQLANPQQEGLVRRVGETRKPVAWFSWGETAPRHGNTRTNRYSI